MPYQGWASYAGTEIWNSERFHIYAQELAPGWEANNCDGCETLADALGDTKGYNTPLVDEPDWFDGDNPDTWKFAGFLATSIVGLTDSTRTAPVLSSTQDGGVVGRVRHTVREISVRGLLLASDQCGLDAGFEWFKHALDGNTCDSCTGSDFCFFHCCPDIADGVVNPDSEPVPTDVELRYGWDIEGGRWINGLVAVRDLPVTATGPEFDPPCDDTTYTWTFTDLKDGQVVSVAVLDADGAVLDQSAPTVLRRENRVPNPSFKNDTNRWNAHGHQLVKVVDEQAADLTLTGDVANGDVLLTAEISAGTPMGQPWAGKMRVELVTPPTGDMCLGLGTDDQVGDVALISDNEPAQLSFFGLNASGQQTLNLQLSACSDIPAGTVIRVSRAILSKGTQEIDYFDGDSQIDGYNVFWTSSRSIMRLDPPTLSVTAGAHFGTLRPQITVHDGDQIHIANLTTNNREVLDPVECAESYVRTLREVTCTEGPTIVAHHTDTDCDGGVVYEVEFLLVAANPWVWNLLNPTYTPVDTGLNVSANDDCPDDGPRPPLSDPDCPLPPDPPRAPVPAQCVEDVSFYRRTAVGIAGDELAPYDIAAPTVDIHTNTSRAVRQVRVRFWPNPLNRTNMADLNECGWCGEMIVSYIPGNSVMTLDGQLERAYVTMPGDDMREASHLLYDSNGGPAKWPELTCGLPYIVTVDYVPTDASVTTTNVKLAVRS